MNKTQLIELIKRKKSFLCIGLDTDTSKIPRRLLSLPDPIFAFNTEIIDATLPYAVAYKPNFAFYEASGLEGITSLHKTMAYLDLFKDQAFTIADAKRGDIGNTSTMYAKSVFDKESSGFDFDAVTVAPYMGKDSVEPFLKFPGKWAILLALTSNTGAQDFQYHGSPGCRNFEKDPLISNAVFERDPLFWSVLQTSKQWGTEENMMYVVGATKAAQLADIRKAVPNHFLLIPGVGAQGGDLQEVAKYGMNDDCGLLVNNSRAIIYASDGIDFAKVAGEKAKEMQQEMQTILELRGII